MEEENVFKSYAALTVVGLRDQSLRLEVANREAGMFEVEKGPSIRNQHCRCWRWSGSTFSNVTMSLFDRDRVRL